MLSGLLKPHNHPSLIPLISENQPFPAYSLLSFRECSISERVKILIKQRVVFAGIISENDRKFQDVCQDNFE